MTAEISTVAPQRLAAEPRPPRRATVASRLAGREVPLALTGVMALWCAVAWQNFSFAYDDLILFGLAGRLGLTKHFLAYNLYEHFSPLDHLFYWIEYHISPFNDLVGAIFAGVMLLAFLLSLDWLLREVGASSRRRAVIVAVIGLSLPIFAITTYWGQAVYIPVAGAFVLCAMAAHVRALSRRAVRWHVAATLLAFGGVFISERTLFIPVFVVLLDAVLVSRGATRRGFLRTLWGQRYSYLPLFAVAIAGAIFIRVFYYLPYAQGGVFAALRLAGSTYTRWFVPALFGYWRLTGVSTMVGAIVAGASLVGAAVALRVDLRNAGPLLMFVAVFVVMYGLLGIERLGLFTPAQEAADVQYMVWILPLAGVAAALLILPRVRLGRRWRRIIAAAAAVASVAVLFDTWHSLDSGGVLAQRRNAHDYFATLRAEIPQLSSARVTVLPLSVGPYVAAPFIWPYERLQSVLPLLVGDIRLGALDPGVSPVVIDDRGRIRPAGLLTDASLLTPDIGTRATATGGTLSSTAAGMCFSADSPDAQLRIPAPASISGDTLMVRISYTSPLPTDIRFTTITNVSYRINVDQSSLANGSHTAVYALDGTALSQLMLDRFPLGRPICMHELAIVHPVVLSPAGGCLAVDQTGVIGGPTACGSATTVAASHTRRSTVSEASNAGTPSE